MVGIQVTQADLQKSVGEICFNLHANYERAVDIKNWLDRNPVVGGTDPLTVAPFSYSPEDATILRQAFADLAYQRDTSFGSSAAVKSCYGLGRQE